MIKILDNFLSSEEVLELHEELWKSDWYLAGTDYALNDRTERGWSFTKYFDPSKEKNIIYQKILDKIYLLPELSDYQCARTLKNAYKFGDVIGVHRDLGYDLTVLIFGNKEWKLNWGSETIFTDEESDDAEIIKSVIPKPGRLLIFDSNIPHTGRVPSSLFPHYRYSVVYNFKKK